jgi:hypothetical protein
MTACSRGRSRQPLGGCSFEREAGNRASKGQHYHYAQEEILLRPGPRLAILVRERKPGRGGAVGAAAVEQGALEHADGAGWHCQLQAAHGLGARVAARHRLAHRLDALG